MQSNSVFRDWLSRRKISDAVIADFCLETGTHFLLGECIVIPVCDANGIFLFNKYRRNPFDIQTPKYVYDKGSKSSLYGWHKAKDSKTILITEGELDTLVAWSANIPAVSSTGGAMTFLPEWAELMKEKEVILCFDNDPAGGDGMARVLDLIPHAKILFLPDGAGVKDISDYSQKGGELGELLKTAVRFSSLEDVINHRAERQSIWLSTHFHDAFIKNHTNKEERKHGGNKSQVSDKVIRAKEYPIDELINFSQGKARCLWHNEKTGSMHFYKETNRVHCFGCGKGGDAIDVYMALNNVAFKDAVEKLQ